ncbi:MAG: DNA repair protein RecO [Cyclobacteriaceae bacterium]
MLFKTRGIVLSHIRFKETSIIAKVFTEEFGLQSYVINGVRSSKGHNKIALYQPMTLLDLVVYKKEQKSIQRISESKCAYNYVSISYDVRKSAVALFWAETLSKTILEEGYEDRRKFEFVYQSLIALDSAVKGAENYPVIFLFGLSDYLGIQTPSPDELVENYTFGQSVEKNRIEKYLMDVSKDNTYKSNIRTRLSALKCLITFYQENFNDLGKLKSLEVLHQVFAE